MAAPGVAWIIDGVRALATMSIGVGQGIALAIERV
jgi:acetyl-CoA acetyltransferase